MYDNSQEYNKKIDKLLKELDARGNAELRTVYFDTLSKSHVLKYLKTRIDDNIALFVSERYPYRRLDRQSVFRLLKRIGIKAGVEEVNPHIFRRTFATSPLDKGVPVEQVQILLGYESIDTILIYAKVNMNTVKINHTKYMD